MNECLPIFEKYGAIVRNSHLVYTSGKHGRDYVNKDALYPYPEVISGLCERVAQHFSQERIDVVLAPALGGIVLSQWTAHHLFKITHRSVLALFAEKADTQEGFVIKRGYETLLPGKRVLVMEDILTTGGSVKKVIAVARKMEAEIVGVAALCNRGRVEPADIGAPSLFSLLQLQLDSWDPGECPMCQQGIPIHPALGKAKR